MRKLYLFNNTQQRGWGNCFSITDDGTVLGNHVCSESSFMLQDLYYREDRKKAVDKYFGDEPYEVEVIEDDEVSTHKGLEKACQLNYARGEEANRHERPTIILEVTHE